MLAIWIPMLAASMSLACGSEAVQLIVDLNGDGVPDFIESDGRFGTGGGRFAVTVSMGHGEMKTAYCGFHPGAIAFDGGDAAEGSPPKLWGYWHLSAFEGSLFYLDLSTLQPSSRLTIHPKSEMGRSVYDAIFVKPRLLSLRPVAATELRYYRDE